MVRGSRGSGGLRVHVRWRATCGSLCVQHLPHQPRVGVHAARLSVCRCAERIPPGQGQSAPPGIRAHAKHHNTCGSHGQFRGELPGLQLTPKAPHAHLLMPSSTPLSCSV